MEKLAEGEAGALFLLFFLLPGLLGAVVYDYLVEREKPETFDRILEALVLTLLSALAVHALLDLPMVPDTETGKDTKLPDIISAFLTTTIFYTTVCAASLAAVFAILNNHDVIYGTLRRLRLTYKTSDGDVWQDTFYRHRRFWVRLRYEDGTTLVGWPKYYSAIGKPRELFLADATWYKVTAAGVLPPENVDGAGVYITDFAKVVSIELLK